MILGFPYDFPLLFGEVVTIDPEALNPHAQQAIDRLLLQYREKTNITAMIAAAASSHDKLEAALFDQIAGRSIDNCVGVQLDRLGVLLGQTRNGLDDDAYRLRLRARVIINRSSGTTADILHVLEVLSADPDTAILFIDEFPAGYRVIVTGLAIPNATELGAILEEITDGGIRFQLDYTNADPSNTFTLDGSLTTQGFDNGLMADALE